MVATNPLDAPNIGWDTISKYNANFTKGGNTVLLDGFDLAPGVIHGDFTSLQPFFNQGDPDASYSSSPDADSYSPNGTGMAIYRAGNLELSQGILTLHGVKGNYVAPPSNNKAGKQTFSWTTGGLGTYPNGISPGYGKTGFGVVLAQCGGILLSWLGSMSGGLGVPGSWNAVWWDTIGKWLLEFDMVEAVFTPARAYGLTSHFATAAGGTAAQASHSTGAWKNQPPQGQMCLWDTLLNPDGSAAVWCNKTLMGVLPAISNAAGVLSQVIGLRILNDLIMGSMGAAELDMSFDWMRAWVPATNTSRAGVIGGGVNPYTAALLAAPPSTGITVTTPSSPSNTTTPPSTTTTVFTPPVGSQALGNTTTDGALTSQAGSGYRWGILVTPQTDATVNNFRWYTAGGAAPQNFVPIIYNVVNGVVGSRVAGGSLVTVAAGQAAGWQPGTITATLKGGQTYLVGLLSGGTSAGASNYYQPNAPTGTAFWAANAGGVGTPDTTFTQPNVETNNYLFAVDVTPVTTPVVTPPPPVTTSPVTVVYNGTLAGSDGSTIAITNAVFSPPAAITAARLAERAHVKKHLVDTHAQEKK